MDNREIDVRIHEEFFDAKITRVMGSDFIELENVPHYSTDIKAAFEVFEKFKYLWLHKVRAKYVCQIRGEEEARFFQSNPDTAPMAICKAALAAEGIEVG